ncbi:MAG: hypothetical protein WC254_01315 [Candidatus Woesearchaeota archaeon]
MSISTLVLALSMAVSAPHTQYDIPVPQKSEPLCQELYVAVRNRRSRPRAEMFSHLDSYLPEPQRCDYILNVPNDSVLYFV